MRILLVPASYAPRVGGLEIAVGHLAAELKRRGHTVAVLTNRYPRSLSGYEIINEIPVHRFLMTKLFPSQVRLGNLVKYLVGVAIAPIQIARLARFIRRFEPTITNVHYLSYVAANICLADHLIPGKDKFVLSLHGSDVTTAPYPTGFAPISRRIVECSDAVSTCSQDMLKYLRLMMGVAWNGHAIVTGNGVEPNEMNNAEAYSAARPYIFCGARLTAKKGQDVLIRAMKNLDDAGIDVDLILAGDGPFRNELVEIAKQLGVESRVQFWGNANRKEMASLLKGCALFVLPSQWESFGIASLEAMVCGKAVVASRAGGIPEVVRDNETGILVPPGDPQALSQAISTLLRDPERRAEMGRRGREIALSDFNWSAVADRYLQTYDLALAR